MFGILHTSELKLFSTKAKQAYLNKKHLNQKFVILAEIHLEFKNKCSERLKMAFFFSFLFFFEVWVVAKLKSFPWKARQSLENCLNQNFVI